MKGTLVMFLLPWVAVIVILLGRPHYKDAMLTTPIQSSTHNEAFTPELQRTLLNIAEYGYAVGWKDCWDTSGWIDSHIITNHEQMYESMQHSRSNFMADMKERIEGKR